MLNEYIMSIILISLNFLTIYVCFLRNFSKDYNVDLSLSQANSG